MTRQQKAVCAAAPLRWQGCCDLSDGSRTRPVQVRLLKGVLMGRRLGLNFPKIFATTFLALFEAKEGLI
jgi:hypothetical protein